MVFDIGWLDRDAQDADGWHHAVGQVTFGDFREEFQADLCCWDPEAYASQWRDAMERLIKSGDRSALVTSFKGHGAAYHFWWPQWLEDREVRIQGGIVVQSLLEGQFDPKAAWAFVGPYRSVDDDNQRLSEWIVSLADVQAWLAKG